MTIKLRDYLRLHPNQGVELLTEFGYYTLTKQEIKTQLRKHGAVRSVTGRPLSFDTLLEQEVLDEQPGDPPLLRTGRKERRMNHADLSKIRSLYEDAVPTWEPRSFIIQRFAKTCAGRHHGDADRNRFGGPVPGELGQRQAYGTQPGG